MPFYQVKNVKPRLQGEDHFIAPNASIIGDVLLKDKASVWFNVVIRAENDSVVIGERSNIQDGCVLHVDPGFPLVIGCDVTVGHKVILHGCTVGNGSLIGMNAVVMNGVVIGKSCIIGANALLTEGMQIPDGAMVLGSPAQIKKILTAEQQQVFLKSAENYVRNAQVFNETLLEVKIEND
jgi:carbonic anhydrase/acetyltransferase-like protein (isoleucine patch superfamily)